MVKGYFIDDNYRKVIIAKARRFCKAKNKALATAGTAAANESEFFNRLLDGKTCTVDKFLDVMRWLDGNTPQAKRRTPLKSNGARVN